MMFVEASLCRSNAYYSGLDYRQLILVYVYEMNGSVDDTLLRSDCKTGTSVNINNARIRSWNQPVLINESKVTLFKKQREPSMGSELTSDMHQQIRNQAL